MCVCVCVCRYMHSPGWQGNRRKADGVRLFCDPMDCSPLDSSVHCQWVASSFSRGSSEPVSNPSVPHCRQILSRHRQQGSYLLPCTKWPRDFAAYSNIYPLRELPPSRKHVVLCFFHRLRSSCCPWALRWVPWCPHDVEDGFPRASNP